MRPYGGDDVDTWLAQQRNHDERTETSGGADYDDCAITPCQQQGDGPTSRRFSV